MAAAATVPALVTAGARLLGRLHSALVTCHCECSGDSSSGALQLFERQVERCGPEHLATVPWAECLAPLGAFLFCLLLGIVLGAAVTFRIIQSPMISRSAVPVITTGSALVV